MKKSHALRIAAVVLLAALAFPAAAWAKDGHSLKDTAKGFLAAYTAGDVNAAKALALTHEQLSAITSRAPDKASYDKALEDFLKEGKLPAGVTLTGFTIEDVMYLPGKDSEKRKKDLTIAVVKPVFSDAKLNARWEWQSLYFIRTDDGWRLSIKK